MIKPIKFFSGKTAIISGGSKGIGKAASLEFVKGGGSVCIIARNKNDLKKAADEISKARISGTQSVTTISCDTTDMKKLKPLIEAHIKKSGVPDYLMNFVGYAQPGYVQDYTIDDFKRNMETNYYGQLVPILILLPHFMKRRSGHIVTCSSLLGYLGMIGYATYCPSKFAICGLTEALRSELGPLGIRFSVLYPPDTRTPGFDNENKTKPAEVMMMSETGGLLDPGEVAQKLMKGIMKNKFYIHPGQSRLLWTIVRHAPNLAHKIMDGEFKKAKQRLSKMK
ncbi:MAG TPA: SDR family oxidoreductase [Spirochaetota bacterium]|nr:SDR family oxidoreductase [Spirochaetota bacterium]